MIMALIDTPKNTIFPKRDRDYGVATKKLKTKESESSSAWASLPLDVGYLILDKLLEPMDHIYFATICRSWCSVSEDYNRATRRWLERKGNHLLPLLIVNDDKKVQLRSVLDENRCYNIRYYGNNCCGYSYGWLAIFDQVGDVHSITLVHPLQISVAPIRLPPLYPLEISKVILSDDPNLNPENYSVAALYRTGRIALLRGGGQETKRSWTYLDTEQTTLKDATFHKNILYALVGKFRERILAFDCGSKWPEAKPQLEEDRLIPSIRYYTFRASYLLESANGDHLWLVRTLVSKITAVHRVKFKVYKAVLDEKEGLVVEEFNVQSIGDEALFLGGVFHSRSVLASNFPGCQPNSIYYTPDKPYNVQHQDGKPYHIFSLENNGTPTDYPRSDNIDISSRVWRLPMFKGLAR